MSDVKYEEENKEKYITNILKMLNKRKYTNIEFHEDTILAVSIRGITVCVFTDVIDKLNVDQIKSHIARLQKQEINHGFLIYRNNPTSTVNKTISTIAKLDLHIELHSIDNLQYDPTEHVLVPEHSLVLSRKKIKEKISLKDLPKLMVTDVISKYYDFRKGDLVKITRNNDITYRLVV